MGAHPVTDPMPGLPGPYFNAGVPGAGTDAVQTLTFGGTPTGGTFKLAFAGQTTAAISWSATNNTLRDNVDAALEALSTIGTGGVVTAVGTMTAGVGTLTVTFSGGNLTKLLVSLISVADNSMTGSSPTLAVSNTTPGVTAAARGAGIGAIVQDTSGGGVYSNTGTALAPTWTQF
jgi:hypothetical protein